jgi:hypothetical protein
MVVAAADPARPPAAVPVDQEQYELCGEAAELTRLEHRIYLQHYPHYS